MATESKSFGSSSMMNRHAMSFESSGINSSSEMIPMGNYFVPITSGTTGFVLPAGMNMVSASPGLLQAGNSPASLLLDSVPGLKHDAGLAVEWSPEEQYKLEQGLEKFRDVPSILKYIKIAATIPDKTVRDIALRCRWMTRKRRKGEEHNVGKKVSNRKDKLVESSMKLSMPSGLLQHTAGYPLFMHHLGQNAGACEGLSGIAMQLLQQNAQAFSQIKSNLSTCKVQENVNLFFKTKNNITAILNDMRETPGIMSQMPPLPVSINEDLANSILLNTTQPIIFGLPGSIQLKQEPRS